MFSERMHSRRVLLNSAPEDYALCLLSSETDSFFLPLALLLANTLLPFAVSMRERNPCLFLLLRCEGWNVLFIFHQIFYYGLQNYKTNPENQNIQKYFRFFL